MQKCLRRQNYSSIDRARDRADLSSLQRQTEPCSAFRISTPGEGLATLPDSIDLAYVHRNRRNHRNRPHCNTTTVVTRVVTTLALVTPFEVVTTLVTIVVLFFPAELSRSCYTDRTNGRGCQLKHRYYALGDEHRNYTTEFQRTLTEYRTATHAQSNQSLELIRCEVCLQLCVLFEVRARLPGHLLISVPQPFD